MSIYYLDGEFVNAADAMLPVHDLAILRGYGVFDYLRTYHQQPFRLMNNIKRLRQSAALVELDYPHSDDNIHEIVLETLRHNIAHDNQDEYTIRILLTGGISPDNISPGDVPRLIIMVQPFKSNPATWYSDGAKVITIELERVFTGAKSTSYLPAIVAMRRAKKQNAIEALYCTPDNHVLEGTTTNLFMFKNGTVITPPAGVLPGITRRIALELCEAHYPVAQHHILLDDLYAADEVFITASNKRIVPIVQINERQIATGQPGDQTRHIMSLFDAITFGQTEPAMT